MSDPRPETGPTTPPSRLRPDASPSPRGAGVEAAASGLSRRDFLRTSGLVGAAIGLDAPLASAAAPRPPGIQRRVTLGRTGVEVPDIGFGTFSLGETTPREDEALIHHALDRGITHFDTAEGYTKGRAEEVLGRALRGRRHEVTITSKFWANPEDSAAHQMEALETSLRKLGTDYVDLYLNHAVNDVARLASPEWQAFADRAKQQGKIRHIGMSGHATRLGECVEYALDHSLVDVLLVAYNFAQQPSFKDNLKQYLNEWLPGLDIVTAQPQLPALLARAHAEGVGVMVMKTLKGARLNDMRAYERPGRTFAQAAFRWVLSEPSVDALVVTMTSADQIDEYVAASGSEGPDREDLALLARYVARNAGSSCVVGCGDCADACPAGVPIGEVLRTRMYALDYGLPGIAAREYAALGRGAEACLTCDGTPCASACPAGVPIPELARDTARRLGRSG